MQLLCAYFSGSLVLHHPFVPSGWLVSYPHYLCSLLIVGASLRGRKLRLICHLFLGLIGVYLFTEEVTLTRRECRMVQGCRMGHGAGWHRDCTVVAGGVQDGLECKMVHCVSSTDSSFQLTEDLSPWQPNYSTYFMVHNAWEVTESIFYLYNYPNTLNQNKKVFFSSVFEARNVLISIFLQRTSHLDRTESFPKW